MSSFSNVKSVVVDGDLHFYSAVTGQVLMIFDAVNDTVEIPTGATLVTTDGAIAVVDPDGVTIDANGAGTTLQVVDASVDLAKLASEVTDLLDLLADLPTSNVASPAIWNDMGVLKVGSA